MRGMPSSAHRPSDSVAETCRQHTAATLSPAFNSKHYSPYDSCLSPKQMLGIGHSNNPNTRLRNEANQAFKCASIFQLFGLVLPLLNGPRVVHLSRFDIACALPSARCHPRTTAKLVIARGHAARSKPWHLELSDGLFWR
eukprot:6008351-Amphidinium_carterae.1